MIVLGSLVEIIGIALLAVLCITWGAQKIIELSKQYKIKKAAAVARETAALIGAEAWLPAELCGQIQAAAVNDDKYLDVPLWLCSKGNTPDVVENIFHDHECSGPCGERSGCQLAS